MIDRKKLYIVLGSIVGGALLLVLVGLLWLHSFKTAGLPLRSGRVAVGGLDAEVSIRYDGKGVPHVEASSERDMVFAMGYVHASERLLQMDGGRRVASGRLSELFGKDTLPIDTFFRTLGMHRTAREVVARADAQTRSLLEAYAAGVNRYAQANTLPLSYRIPGNSFEFAPWTVEDTVVMAGYMSYLLAVNWERELVGYMLAAERGADVAKMLLPKRGRQGPFTTRPTLAEESTSPSSATVATSAAGPDLAALLPESSSHALARLLSFGRPGAGSSNSWAVSGKHTKSGKPILANDPHLGLELPSVWYEIGLTFPGAKVRGVSLPGVPYVILGHTDTTAWGSTTGYGDTQDLYVLKPVPDDDTKYLYDGAPRAFDVVTETIAYVEGDERKERTLEVRLSLHGPVISDVVPELREAGAGQLALRWTALDPDRYDLASLRRMTLARDWKDFSKALRGLAFMSQNWVYADASGTIAFLNAGDVPKRRAGHDGTMPAPGWTSEYAWDGFIPWDELPQLVDPEPGFIVTANNAPFPPGEDAHGFSSYFCTPYRARRATQMLAEKLPEGGLVADDLRRMQLDLKSLGASRMVPHMVKALAKDADALSDAGRKALALLKEWDFVMSADSAATTVFHETYRRAFEMVYADEMSPQVYQRFRSNWQIEELDPLLGTDSPFFDDRGTADRTETQDHIVVAAFGRAVELLSKKLGDDPSQWRWGRLHTITFDHPFALADRSYRDWFSEGPHELGGSVDTIWMAWPFWWDDDYECEWGPSMRFVVDMADTDAATIVVPPGQSGHVPCPHYSDQIADWLEGRSHAMPLDRATIEANCAGGVLVLAPE